MFKTKLKNSLKTGKVMNSMKRLRHPEKKNKEKQEKTKQKRKKENHPWLFH